MLVYDLADPRQLVGETRGTLSALDAQAFTLSQFLPVVTDNTIDFQIDRRAFDPIVAGTFRAWDVESVIGARVGFARVRGELAPISRKIPLTEYQRLRVATLGGQNPNLVAEVFNDARRMANSVAARLELARGQVLSTGVLTINERGLNLTADFAIPSDLKVTPGTLWSNHASADPVTDLVGWLQTYRIANYQRYPGAIVTSTAVLNHLLANASFRGYLGMNAPSGLIIPGTITRELVNQVLAAYNLPPIITYDVQVTTDAGVVTPILPVNKLLLLPGADAGEAGRVGDTLLGVTAESLELANAGYLVEEELAGIVAVTHSEDSPVTKWTEAVAVGLPIIRNPHAIMIATVA